MRENYIDTLTSYGKEVQERIEKDGIDNPEFLKGYAYGLRVAKTCYNRMRGERRRAIVKALVGVAVFIVLSLAVFGFIVLGDYCDTHYTKEALVIDVNEDTGAVAVVSLDSNEWEFYAEAGTFAVGDEIKATFYNNLTNYTIYDDEIVKAKKIR